MNIEKQDSPMHPDMSATLFLSDGDVAALANWKAAFQALREAYLGNIESAMVPPKSMARGAGKWLRSLTAVSPGGGHLGCKLIAANVTNRRASYLISLFDQKSTALTFYEGDQNAGG